MSKFLQVIDNTMPSSLDHASYKLTEAIARTISRRGIGVSAKDHKIRIVVDESVITLSIDSVSSVLSEGVDVDSSDDVVDDEVDKIANNTEKKKKLGKKVSDIGSKATGAVVRRKQVAKTAVDEYDKATQGLSRALQARKTNSTNIVK